MLPVAMLVGIRCYHPNPKWDMFEELLDALGGRQGKSEQHSKQWLLGKQGVCTEPQGEQPERAHRVRGERMAWLTAVH